MTPEQTAEAILERTYGTRSTPQDRPFRGLVAEIADAIRDAQAAEREACAALANDCDKSIHPADIADAIRSRTS